jgi:hypothetical protein
MTVAELRNMLADFDAEMEVRFAYGYGDYWNTEVAADITEAEVGQVQYSAYHKSDKVVDPYKDNDDDSINALTAPHVVILR